MAKLCKGAYLALQVEEEERRGHDGSGSGEWRDVGIEKGQPKRPEVRI